MQHKIEVLNLIHKNVHLRQCALTHSICVYGNALKIDVLFFCFIFYFFILGKEVFPLQRKTRLLSKKSNPKTSCGPINQLRP